MANLLEETIKMLMANGKTPQDVLWVGIIRDLLGKELKGDVAPIGTWEDFAGFADFEYYEGYGGTEIDTDLKIVGKGWWLERGEYDGSEWWEFKTLPKKPSKTIPLRETDLQSD